MKKILFLVLVFVSVNINVFAQSLYAMFNEQEKTLTFHYDTQAYTRQAQGQGTAYFENYDEYGNPEWLAVKYDVTKVVFSSDVAKYKPTTCMNWFSHFSVLKEIEGLEYLDTSKVTDMSEMFSTCAMLKSLDLSNFDTRNVTNMTSMFLGCQIITSLDVSKFNTSNVTDMTYMFNGCYDLNTLDVSHFNTSKVKSMRQMFARCRSLTTLDVSNFDMQNVVNVEGMFCNCENLVTIYCEKDWKRSGISGTDMFDGCFSLMGGRGTKFYEGPSENGSYHLLQNDGINSAHPDDKSTPGAFAT